MRAIRIAKGGYIASSIAFCAAGICLLIRPEISAAVICRTFGILLLICGIFKICGYLAKDLYRLAFQFDLAFGIFISAIGLLMLLRSGQVVRFFNLVSGIVVLADGLFKIQTAIDAKCFGMGKWWLIAAEAALTSILGLLIVLEPFRNFGVIGVMTLLGLALLMEGLLNLSVAVYMVKIAEQRKLRD